MIDAHNIDQRQRCAESFDPPVVAAFFQHIPTVERVPPQLSGGAEVIGRHTGDHRRPAFIVEEEQLRMRPDIGAVVGDEDGNISQDLNTQVINVLLQCQPLIEEEILDETLVGNLVSIRAARRIERSGFAPSQSRIPGRPGTAAVGAFQCSEQRIVVEPGCLSLAERLEIGAQVIGVSLLKSSERAPQDALFEWNDRAIINGDVGQNRRIGKVRRRQQRFFEQNVEVDQQRVAGKGGETLVGRVAIAGRTERHHLPDTLTRSRQQIGKIIRAISQVTNPPPRRERCRMQQDTAGSLAVHRSSSQSSGFSL